MCFYIHIYIYIYLCRRGPGGQAAGREGGRMAGGQASGRAGWLAAACLWSYASAPVVAIAIAAAMSWGLFS